MRVVIFHFNPIEKFPPVMNLIRLLETKLPGNVHLVVFTTRATVRTELFQSTNKQVKIKRFGLNTIHMNALLRYFNYLRYFLGSLAYCLFSKPDKFFYYESMSALVPLLLKKFIFKKAPLFIHYHEYMSALDYKHMYLSGLFHRLEKKLYEGAAWISQTNPERMQLFLQDIGTPDLGNVHVYPNYPLREWGKYKTTAQINLPVRLVYVGSFGSMETIYIKEALEWIKEQQGKITLDIYSFNIPENVTAYVKSLNCAFIQILEAVNYYELPGILKDYDAGLILYKGTSKNFEYNAPNKLFEYLVCGLDVWYPATMKGVWMYDSPVDWPKVVRLDFEKLRQYGIEEFVYRQTGAKRTINFTCEDASKDLVDNLIYDKQ